MKPIKVIEYKDCTIKVYHDEDATSPREWDNLGEMICEKSRDYEWGDRQEDLTEQDAKRLAAGGVYLPFGLLDWHKGARVRGWMIVSAEKIREEYGVKRISLELRKRVTKILKGEIEAYQSWIDGEVFGYVAETAEGHHIGSCWGFYLDDGDTEYPSHMVSEVKLEVDAWAQNNCIGAGI